MLTLKSNQIILLKALTKLGKDGPHRDYRKELAEFPFKLPGLRKGNIMLCGSAMLKCR